MASEHTTEASSLSRVSPLELGAVVEDMRNPGFVDRAMEELCDENPAIASMLLKEAEAELVGPASTTKEQVALKYGLMMYNLSKRTEKLDSLERLLGQVMPLGSIELSA